MNSNPMLAAMDQDTFVSRLLDTTLPFPSYYRFIAPQNLRGPDPYRPRKVPYIGADDLDGVEPETRVVDARSARAFAAGHRKGSLAVPWRRDFATWVGWMVMPGAPIAVIVEEGQPAEEMMRELARIGHDNIVGFVLHRPGNDTTYRLVDVEGFAVALQEGRRIVDVRAPNEWEAKDTVGAIRCHVPDLAARLPQILTPGSEVWIGCETGYRATIAASVAEILGYHPVVLAGAGIPDVMRSLAGGSAGRMS